MPRKKKAPKRKKIWVCCACGKRSNDRYGDDPIDRGWDESCMINAQEFYEDECILGESGRVIEVRSKDGNPDA